MATFAFVVHPAHPEASDIAARAERWLVDRGHAVVRVDDEDGAARRASPRAPTWP